MPPENSPTVRHRRLAAELRHLREAANLTPADAAAALGWSKSKLTRFETAATRPQPADVAAMFGLYGGDEALKLALVELARKIRTRGWWATYSDVLAPSFVELENDASTIRTWGAHLIHGLLQTPDYTRAVIRADVTDEAEVNRRLQAREHRKAVLAREDAPRLDVVLDEAVLRRPVGGPEVMRGQLRALLEAGQRENITVRVVPIEAGAYPNIGAGSVTIFGFPRQIDLDVAHVESFAGGVFVEDLVEVRRCSVTVDRISELALSEERSAALIRAITEE
ncbi:helix-turn-helix domain-containing protein [Actinomadura alba]|uniref:Helix-turn-helix domain-containing protein n=1 Tax=Actinomadura alba TaxID=406431 RepID=A0ABR7LHT6_9ACTN|nr:helix-turn-helix transcriptional regulator [Actinomadura alba]MBC6464238.1 helix-turn-helix domain-containing protein [Actinomadura alba]